MEELLGLLENDDWARLLISGPFARVIDRLPAAEVGVPPHSEECWNRLYNGGNVPPGLQRLCGSLGSQGCFRGTDPSRLHRNARRFFATGMAAYWLCGSTHREGTLQLGCWLGRAIGESDVPVVVEDTFATLSWRDDAEVCLRQLLAQVGEPHRLPLHLWLTRWLSGPFGKYV